MNRGKKLAATKFLNTKEELDSFLSRLEDASLVMEASSIWEHVYEAIESRGFEVKLANPLKTRAIADARIKTDKIDAKVLAHLNRTDLVTECYVPPRHIRELSINLQSSMIDLFL